MSITTGSKIIKPYIKTANGYMETLLSSHQPMVYSI